MLAAVLNQVPNDALAPEGGVLDQIEPIYTVHLVERYWWRWEDEPDGDPQYLGQKRLGTTLRVPFPFDVTVRPIRIYMVTVTEDGVVNATQIKTATQVVYPQAPTFTSAAFDTVNLDIDMVFNKNSSGTGNITVEYKKLAESVWLTHATTFSHSATSGSLTIAQEATSQTYQLRLKQIGIENYSRTIEVTVLGSGGGNTPPTFTSITYDSANSEADLVFAKNGSATTNIQVEYKLTSDSTWLTHATEFAHGATSGSIVIAEQATALTYDVRLKQIGVTGQSTTRQVTVDANPGTPPSNLTADETDLGECDWQIDLDWDAGSGSGTYTVERKVGTGSWNSIATGITATDYVTFYAGHPSQATSVYYRVKQTDVSGYSNTDFVSILQCDL